MSPHAVIREAGPGWVDGGIEAQPGLAEHTAFMDQLAEEGVVVFAGPLAGTEGGRLRVLLIMRARSDDEIRERLESDPWADRLAVTSVEPWNVFVGAERLSNYAKRR